MSKITKTIRFIIEAEQDLSFLLKKKTDELCSVVLEEYFGLKEGDEVEIQCYLSDRVIYYKKRNCQLFIDRYSLNFINHNILYQSSYLQNGEEDVDNLISEAIIYHLFCNFAALTNSEKNKQFSLKDLTMFDKKPILDCIKKPIPDIMKFQYTV